MVKQSAQAAPPFPLLVEKLRQALELQKNGDLTAAEAIYKDLARENPDNPDVLLMAGIFYNQAEKYPYAATLLKKVLAKKSADAIANKAMGKALYETGKYDEARQCLEKALAADLDDPEANALMGLALHKMGNLKAAENFYRRSLKARDSAQIRNRYAEILLLQKRHPECAEMLEEMLDKNQGDYDSLIRYIVACGEGDPGVMNVIIAAILNFPRRDEIKTLFGLSLTLGAFPEFINDDLARALTLCLQSPNVDHAELRRAWLVQVFEDPKNAQARILLLAKDYQSFSDLYAGEERRKNLLQPLFIDGARKIIVFSPDIERLMIFLRRHYLEAVARGKQPADFERALLPALASQSFFNEFIFAETEEEKTAIAALKSKIESAADLKTVENEAAIYASYRPLSTLGNAAAFLFAPPDFLKDTVRIHLAEPQEELKIKKSLRKLGKIEDEISRNVQAQYEENPYPRWQSCNYLRTFLTSGVAPAFKRKDKVLIAGCGTGKHVLMRASIYPDMQLTAIDLSGSSLAYAVRKAREYAMPNVEFVQADILELGRLKEKFDFIESVGVLHHMRDPLAGLKTLVELLAPGGEILLGLYSEYARRNVVEIRDIIAKKGFPPTLEGIRKCRAYIKDAPESEFQFLKSSTDFYAASTCRDLMFHAQEIRYTIPKIEEFIATAGLEFKEFVLPAAVKARYLEIYPGDKHANHLKNWDELEQNNPSFFAGMYQFTVKKQ